MKIGFDSGVFGSYFEGFYEVVFRGFGGQSEHLFRLFGKVKGLDVGVFGVQNSIVYEEGGRLIVVGRISNG